MSLEQVVQQLVEAINANTLALKDHNEALKLAGAASAKPDATAEKETTSKKDSQEQQTKASADSSTSSSSASSKGAKATSKSAKSGSEEGKTSRSSASLPAPTNEELIAMLRPWLNEHPEGSDEREERKTWLADALARTGAKKVTELTDSGRKTLALWLAKKKENPDFDVAASMDDAGGSDDDSLLD